ncbi:epithelial cell-transforming sequence 2 oncogene-like isoform X2 [Xiphophorus hellerii]|uniref:epithelial cell-transforming sequence 2 oncogene-like isoform X2 n=1 Tax=Xiphophorus hellerii TaxID=8084 RepID=UPI0013B4756E|nr:epithelial cell-transforming sequence 2 oncogene-like isoform X2 [Xiphophorus hellerii]
MPSSFVDTSPWLLPAHSGPSETDPLGFSRPGGNSFAVMDLTGTPHSMKLWQHSSPDREPQPGPKLVRETRFSSWTPQGNKQSNLQLFEERVKLLLHWFDLWTDSQRKRLLQALLGRCTKAQLKHCRNLLNDTVPVTRLDFTAVLPRCLSLYIMSFLSPRELCGAAQVSWHWRVLAEQDCLWAGRCIKRGWFLPYAPRDKEFGAWRNHYVSCVSTLDRLSPQEAAEIYGTLYQPRLGVKEEEGERSRERRIRQKLKEALKEEKRLALISRRPWGSNPKSDRSGGERSQTVLSSSELMVRSWPSLSSPMKTVESPTASLSPHRGQHLDEVSRHFASQPKVSSVLASTETGLSKAKTVLASLPHSDSAAILLLISNKIPAYEVVLSGVKARVAVVLYDHRWTLSALFNQMERAASGQQVQRLGLLVPGGTEEVHLVNGSVLSERTLSSPDHREFWEKLCALVAPGQEGGGIDIFCPLAASVPGLALMWNLSDLTGLEVRAPLGFATGSFQNILSEWSGGDQDPAAPALCYVTDSVLLGWCRQARWMEEVLVRLRKSLELQLQQASLQARGRALGLFLWENISLNTLGACGELSEALTEGLTALSRQNESRPVEFLSSFLMKWSKEDGERSQAAGGSSCPGPPPGIAQATFDWRCSVGRELLHSERLYLGRMRAVLKVYQEPLMAALNSNRAILSYVDIQIIFGSVALILHQNGVFQADLQARLQHWGAEQCVGDVFVKFCSKLNVYTNYLNNYITTIHTIDKCREAKPAFRAFLKRADRTLPTHMLSLQELLLCPVWRIQEYVTLLQALTSHTRPGHPDHPDLRSALNAVLQFRNFIQELERNSEADRRLEETQELIRGCPSLAEGNRQLIITQDAMLLRSPDEQIPDSLRAFEHVCDVGLFLFSDALVLTRRRLQHIPFTMTHRSTHTFWVSVALSSLDVREVLHTRYVRHAFVLDGPRCSWVCATEQEEERDNFLSALRSAISSSLTEQQ